jgi:hypothetical protein
VSTENPNESAGEDVKLFLTAEVELGVLYEPYLAVIVLRDQKT